MLRYFYVIPFFGRSSPSKSAAQIKPPKELSAIESLPSELLINIFSSLDSKSLTRVMQVTRLFAACARDDSLWQRHVHALLTVNPKLNPGEKHYGFLCRYKPMFDGLNKLAKLNDELFVAEVSKLLRYAVKFNLDTFFCMVLDKYPDVDVNNTNDQTSSTMAHQAASNNNVIILQRLIDKGANINARCDGYISGGEIGIWIKDAGLSVLETAANSGARGCVELLLKASPRIVNDFNSARWMSALHYASERGSLDCVRLLTTSINMRHTNNEGKTAYELAKEKGHEVCAQFLAEEMQKSAISIPKVQSSQCRLQ